MNGDKGVVRVELHRMLCDVLRQCVSSPAENACSSFHLATAAGYALRVAEPGDDVSQVAGAIVDKTRAWIASVVRGGRYRSEELEAVGACGCDACRCLRLPAHTVEFLSVAPIELTEAELELVTRYSRDVEQALRDERVWMLQAQEVDLVGAMIHGIAGLRRLDARAQW